MAYTVTHLPSIPADLASIWLSASDRNAVAAASDEIDCLLRSSPDSVGQDCGDHRELIIAPLSVAYTYSVDDCVVTIIRIDLLE